MYLSKHMHEGDIILYVIPCSGFFDVRGNIALPLAPCVFYRDLELLFFSQLAILPS